MYTEEDMRLFWQAYQETFYPEEECFNENLDRELLDADFYEQSL